MRTDRLDQPCDVDTFRMSVILFRGAKLRDSGKVQRYLKRGWRVEEVGPVRVLNKHVEGYSVVMKRSRKNRRSLPEKCVHTAVESDPNAIMRWQDDGGSIVRDIPRTPGVRRRVERMDKPAARA